MAIKKSELPPPLRVSCDELRGGMDASQYKNYVLVLLFVKYVSDKYAGAPCAPITIPENARFKDMVALKGKPGSGQKIVAPLTKLISIFENKALDFSRNRAGNDDILGDACEYLMRHFAAESGKSKGQDAAASGLARMNMILHNNPAAEIKQGNTLANPRFTREIRLI